MYKKTIKYVDYDGNEREEDFYFNLSKAEIMEMQLSMNGGLSSYIQKIVSAQDVPTLSALFKDLVLKSYGEKSSDGRRFIKSKEISDSFEQTEAYSELFMELVADADAAAEFVNGIIPKDLSAKMSSFKNDVTDKDTGK